MLAGSTPVETFGERSQALCFSFVEGLIKKKAKIYCATEACEHKLTRRYTSALYSQRATALGICTDVGMHLYIYCAKGARIKEYIESVVCIYLHRSSQWHARD